MSITIEQLEQCREAMLAIERTEDAAAHIEARTTNATSRITGMPHSGNVSDGTSMAVCTLLELKDRWLAEVFQYAELVFAVENEIKQLPSPLREMVRWRYVLGYEWEDISRKANYCVRHCHRLVAQGVRIITA